ncbi:hypothetical protein CJ430_30920, partial [Klebsiella pneumoniae]
DAQRACGIESENIVISGGAGQHPLVRQLLADARGVSIVSTASREPVLTPSAPAELRVKISSSAAEPGSIRWCVSCWPTL